VGLKRQSWSEFAASRSAAHLVVAIVPDVSGHRAGRVSLREMSTLMARAVRHLEMPGAYAITKTAEAARPEVWCTFEREADADRLARIVAAGREEDASGWGSRRTFELDQAAIDALTAVTGQRPRKR
jgi:hypothetical protein